MNIPRWVCVAMTVAALTGGSRAQAEPLECDPGDVLIDRISDDEIVCLDQADLGTYTGVTPKLRAQAQAWNGANDVRAGFAESHACMSEGITRRALAREFDNNMWILELNRRFAESFLKWLNKWESRTGRGDMPERWWLAFSRAQAIQHDPSWPGPYDPRYAKERVTLLLAGAHIFNDIPDALRAEGCRSRKDYDAIIKVVDQCERQAIGSFNKMLKDWGAYIGYPGANAIVDWRRAAWKEACG